MAGGKSAKKPAGEERARITIDVEGPDLAFVDARVQAWGGCSRASVVRKALNEYVARETGRAPAAAVPAGG